jgi:hypothetical protein
MRRAFAWPVSPKSRALALGTAAFAALVGALCAISSGEDVPGVSVVRCERSRLSKGPGENEMTARFEGAVVARTAGWEFHGDSVEVVCDSRTQESKAARAEGGAEVCGACAGRCARASYDAASGVLELFGGEGSRAVVWRGADAVAAPRISLRRPEDRVDADGSVSVVLRSNSRRPKLRLDGGALRWDGRSRTLRLTGGATLRSRGVAMSGAEAQVVFAPPEAGRDVTSSEVQSAVVSGSVRVEGGGATFRCERAIYESAEGLVRLYGLPTAVVEGVTLSAPEIAFRTGSGEITAEGGLFRAVVPPAAGEAPLGNRKPGGFGGGSGVR